MFHLSKFLAESEKFLNFFCESPKVRKLAADKVLRYAEKYLKIFRRNPKVLLSLADNEFRRAEKQDDVAQMHRNLAVNEILVAQLI